MKVSAVRTIIVDADANPSLNATVLAQPLLWPIANPGAVRDYSIDITAPLIDIGDTIASVSVAAMPSGAGELTVGQVTVAGDVVTARLGPGLAGRNYTVQVTVTTAGAEVLQYEVGLLIDPRLAAFPLPAPPSAGFGTAVTWLASPPPPSPALFLNNPANASLWDFPGQVVGAPIVAQPPPPPPVPPSPALFFNYAPNASLWEFPGKVVGVPTPIYPPAPPPSAPAGLFFNNPADASLFNFPGIVVGQPIVV